MLHRNKLYLITTNSCIQSSFKHFSKLIINAHFIVMYLVYTDVLYILMLQPALNQTVRTNVVDTVLAAGTLF